MLDSIKNNFYLSPLLYSNEVQPSEIYGSETHLVASYSAEMGIGQPRPNMAFFNLRFSLSLLLLVLLSVFYLFFRKNFSSLLRSVLHFRKFWSYRRSQGWSHPLFFMFLFLFSAASLALFFAEILRNNVPILSETESFFFLFAATCGVAIVFMLLRFFVCWLIGVISNEKRLFSDIIYSQVLFFAAMSFAIVPIILVKNFCVESWSIYIFMLLYFLLLLIFSLYFFRTIRLFIQENNSIFFWILYFCTIEILPVVIAIKILGGIQ